MVACLGSGGLHAGPDGLIVGIAAGQAFRLPAHAWIARRYGLWMPAIDLAGLACSALVVGGVLWARGAWG